MPPNFPPQRKYYFFPAGLVLMAVLCLPGISCISTVKRPALIEPAAMPLKDQPYKILGPARGEASSYDFLWFINATGGANMDRAVQEMINARGGDALIDLRVYEERQYWILGTIHILDIEGKVIQYEIAGID